MWRLQITVIVILRLQTFNLQLTCENSIEVNKKKCNTYFLEFKNLGQVRGRGEDSGRGGVKK